MTEEWLSIRVKGQRWRYLVGFRQVRFLTPQGTLKHVCVGELFGKTFPEVHWEMVYGEFLGVKPRHIKQYLEGLEQTCH